MAETRFLAFRRVLQTAVVHVQSAGKDEADVGDVLAAILREPRSHAVVLLKGHGISRLDVLNYISHGIRKGPPVEREDEEGLARMAEILSDREIVTVPSTAMALGGGGVGCITQQQPAGTLVR